MLPIKLLICCIALGSASRLIRRELEVTERTDVEVIYSESSLTCYNGDQKISQPCNGDAGTGCAFDTCMQHCFEEIECNFFFHAASTIGISTYGCILYRACDETRNAAYFGTTVEITRTEKPSTAPTAQPSIPAPTEVPSQAPSWRESLKVVYDQSLTTCFNGEQKISQPCDGKAGFGCSFDACLQHCYDQDECIFLFHITPTSGCILYNSCDETRNATYPGTTVEVMLRPTHAPTSVSPTFSPSGSPTTESPSKSPTSNPSQSPTRRPTMSPSAKPSAQPSKAPTSQPSKSPSVQPTRSPSKAPSSGPTKSPSAQPTRSPSKTPTSSPTQSPTSSPTKAPTSSPTKAPTSQPSMSPSSSEPTKAPTMADGFNVIYYQTSLTCDNGDQKISQPCNGGTGTGCTYDVCMQHCFDEIECNFFFHITSTSGCILYRSCDDTRNPAYSGTTVEITREGHGLNVIYYETKLTCDNGDQKISQPCNGVQGTGCTYEACVQHCFDENECNFFFYITSRNGCILYRSCDDTRTPTYSGTTLAITQY
jgi:hypothetical protein